ncbi:MAG: hypothetical protein NC832_00925 [Candidatus Omnitrophica bacterium]|nr:hypothetical protein [Candidatus Omnitrophota bacterium]
MQRISKTKYLVATIALSILFGMTGCGKKEEKKEEKLTNEEKIINEEELIKEVDSMSSEIYGRTLRYQEQKKEPGIVTTYEIKYGLDKTNSVIFPYTANIYVKGIRGSAESKTGGHRDLYHNFDFGI